MNSLEILLAVFELAFSSRAAFRRSPIFFDISFMIYLIKALTPLCLVDKQNI